MKALPCQTSPLPVVCVWGGGGYIMIKHCFNLAPMHVTLNFKFINLSGQQIRSKIDSFQNAYFFISQPNPMMLPLIGIVSERQFQ